MRKFLLSLTMFVAGAISAWATVEVPTEGVYTIKGGGKTNEGYRGFLAAGEGFADYPVLSDIEWSNYAGNSTTAIENGTHWYVKSDGNGKFYIYNLGLQKFIVAGGGSNINFGDTPYAWTIEVNNTEDLGSDKGLFNSIRNTDATTYLCFACGKKGNARPVFFNNQAADGGSLHTFTAVEGGATTYAEKIEAVNNFIAGYGELTYVLTDELGNKYEGTYEGFCGASEPTLEGVTGYTFENPQWNEKEFSATIVFPFPISDETTTNATMICAFSQDNMKWYVNGKNVYVDKDAEPTDMYLWAIYPSFSNGAFAFTIKNITTGNFVYSTSNDNSHAVGTVTVEETGSDVTFENNQFKLSTGKYLSVNSTNTADEQPVGTWTSHNGSRVKFIAVETEEPGEGEETGIDAVETEEEVVIYDLTGRRVEKMQKGIYIVNGKKVVIK